MPTEGYYNHLGDKEVSDLTIRKTKYGVQSYHDLLRRHSPQNPFRDNEFGHDIASVGNIDKLFDSARPGSIGQNWMSRGWNRQIDWMRVQDMVKTRGLVVTGGNLTGNERVKFSVSNSRNGHFLNRQDIQQGCLGDCWFVAALAEVAEENELIDRVVPRDNEHSFESGICHFCFWFQGFWIDVVVDDYLPCVRLDQGRTINLIGSNVVKNGSDIEIWVALAEKAYAKLHGNYEMIAGGRAVFAFENLSGGLIETRPFHDQQNPLPKDFYQFLQTAFGSRALISLSCNKNFNGLRAGHAYSVTNVAEVQTYHGQTVRLVRVRNPWGRTEWNGDWSDPKPNSRSRWDEVPEQTRRDLQVVDMDDGEFWMSYEDMVYALQSVGICYGTKPGEVGQPNSKLKYEQYHGEWSNYKRTTGGCNEITSNIYNPQFTVDVDSINGNCTLMIQIGLKNDLHSSNQLCYGFKVFRSIRGRKPPYGNDFFSNPSECEEITQESVDRGANQTWDRIMLKEYRVKPGLFVIIPCTFYPQQEGRFYLRILSSRRPTR